ncbi:hypothetical protein EYF80_003206 [Liparis tanakae]|uniref:Uncharacterized protein n=1 Tax=Liparis tanakae TaxID=230148 RepID=A0A4Z2J896_9TELE|nr:hypothetical protein EYF80_003206 [Liparis tanakae]
MHTGLKLAGPNSRPLSVHPDSSPITPVALDGTRHIEDGPRGARHREHLPPHSPWPHSVCRLPPPPAAICLCAPQTLIIQHRGPPHKQGHACVHKRQQHEHPAPPGDVNHSQQPASGKHGSGFIAHDLGRVAQAQLPATFQQPHRGPVHSDVLDGSQGVHDQKGSCHSPDMCFWGQESTGEARQSQPRHRAHQPAALRANPVHKRGPEHLEDPWKVEDLGKANAS